MALIKCPECGHEISDMAKSCPQCGLPMNDVKNDGIAVVSRVCPECGEKLNNGVTLCDNCGYDSASVKNSSKLKKIIIPIIASSVAFVIAIFLFVKGYKQINNEEYDFYKQHYEECLDGYDECIKLAKQNSGYYRDTYNWLADEYMELADYDKDILNKNKRNCIIYCVVGGLLIVVGGFILIFGGKKYGVN